MIVSKYLILGLLVCLLYPEITSAQPIAPSDTIELSEGESRELLSTLKTKYAGYESEIASARIKYRVIRLDCLQSKVTPQQAVQIIDQLQIDSLQQDLVQAFRSDLFKEGRTDLWREKELLVRGKDWISLGGYHDQYVQDDLHVLVEESNNQVKCYDRGNCRIWTERFSWFRSLPPQKVFQDVKFFRVGDRIESHFQGTPNEPISWTLLGKDDLLIQRLHLANTAGEPAKESFFQHFTTFAGGIQFPMVKIDMSYAQGHVNLLTATLVTEARFNINIPDKEFIRSRPKRSSWVDLRNDQKNGGYFSNDVPDILKFFSARKNLPRPVLGKPEEIHNSELTTWIFMINGLLLILMGVYLWKRVPS